jgi:Ca2+-binding EF-hand superfamily protein
LLRFSIELSHLERILHLAGQNLSKTTVENIKQNLKDIYETDEVFLDDIEPILALHWEELTNEDIRHILLDSFETFDNEQQGILNRQDLIDNLTRLGDMPLNGNDFKMMFSMMETSSMNFDYRQFVAKLCGLDSVEYKTKNKKKKTMRIKKKKK